MKNYIVGVFSIVLFFSCEETPKTSAQNDQQNSERVLILDTLGNEITIEKSSKIATEKPLVQTCNFGEVTINLEEKNQKLFVNSNCKVVEDFVIDLDAKLETLFETDSMVQQALVRGIAAGETTELFTKSATKSLLATSLVAGVGGGVTGRLAPKIGSTIGGLETSVQGFVIGLLSNSLRLQNKITKFYNNATNGVAEAMTDHVNLGYGVVKRAVNTFDEE